jgi:arylsulfatase A-like enzyme
MNSKQENQVGLGGMAVLGAAVVASWCLHDLLIFVTSGQPELAQTLLLPSLILVCLGLFAGGLLGALRRYVPAWVLMLGALAVLGVSFKFELKLDVTRLLLVRSLAAIELAILIAAVLVERSPAALLRGGLTLGAVIAVGMGALQVDLEMRSWLLLGTALVLLGLAWLPKLALRALISVGLLLAAGIPIWLQAIERNVLTRPELPSPSVPVQGPGRDLLLVVLDTVRADRLAPYGYERQTTPLLDAFVNAEAERYTWARSTSSWTLPSHASLFTGLLPSEHGATHPRSGHGGDSIVGGAAQAQRLRDDVSTLAETLRSQGYRTGAVVANHYYLKPTYGLDRGYQSYDARPGGFANHHLPLAQLAWMPNREGQQSYRDALSVTDRALAWLDRDPGDRPQFLTVNYMDAHSPYLPPPPHDEAFGGGAVKQPRKLKLATRSIQYDRCLHYIDTQLMRLLDAVDMEQTVVIITSDHGEALGDHGYWMHGWTLLDSITRVPLYVHPVGRERIAVRAEPISGDEIFNLALFELGLGEQPTTDPERPTAEWFQPLEIPKVKALADKDLARDLLIWIEGERKWTVTSTGQVNAVHITQDPGEMAPLDLTEAEVAAAQARAKAWWAANPPLEREATLVEEGDLGHLQDLGYLGEEE